MSNKNPIWDIPHYLRIFQAYLGARMYLILLLTLIAALAEGVGILMLLPLLQGLDAKAGDSGSTAITGHSAWIQDLLVSLGLADSTVAALLIITGAFIAKGVLVFGAEGYNAYLRGKLLRELKGRLFDQFTRMAFNYYASRDTGHFINIVNVQTNGLLTAFNALTRLGALLTQTITYTVLAFIVSWTFGLMAVAFGAGILGLFLRLNVYVRQLSRSNAVENGKLAKLCIQSLQAFSYLSATAQFAPLKHAVNASIRRLTGNQIRFGIAEAFTSSVREPIAIVFIMLIVLTQVVILGQPVAPILVSILLFYRAINTTFGIQATWQQVLNYAGSVEIVHEEFDLQRQNQERDGIQPMAPLSQEIRFQDVYYRYDTQTEDVIKGISFHIPARTSIALVGESGSGKTTLVDLIALLLKPTRGTLFIDGVPADRVQLTSWRKQIGYVSQDTVTFDDSIANNISSWSGDASREQILMERIRDAARKAHLAHFVETLPDGYHTLVGDRGMRLSGGQRQRLFIARELFRNPKLLILDEATSALDAESEKAIQQSIEALRGTVTVIIIAHRLATVSGVDQIAVIDQGRLVEHGGYSELRNATESHFAKLVAAQAIT